MSCYRKVIFLFSLFSFLFVPVFGENIFSARISPVIAIPTLPQFNVSVGGVAVIDWSFLSFGKFAAGVSAGGGFLSVPVKVGAPLSFMDGMAGIFVNFRPFDRWVFQVNIFGGVYQLTRGDLSYAKAFGSLSVAADFFLSPLISLFVEGRFTYRVFDVGNPFSSIGGAIGVRFNLSEILAGRTRVQIEKTEQHRIFPVSWAWYENNPVASVSLSNEEPNAITNVTLSFFMDSYMSQPFTFAVLPRLAPGENTQIPVTALFNDIMLGLKENVNANSVIQIQYNSIGARKEAEFPIQMPIFHRNTISWDDDRRAAAFVSPRDSAARLFARYVASTVDLHLESGMASGELRNMPKNVRYAAAMFEALRLYGISYVVDPAMSFANLHIDESALDNLTYPYESLYYRGGDCGHLSILFCSLLETLDIQTAFITVPGHIFIAFEIGDNNWMAGSREIIEINGGRWLPVEITVPDEGFSRAWRIGARQWSSWGDDADFFPIRECWEIYPSVTVNASVDYPPEMPPASDIVTALEAELRR